jgi:hypothetical protein
LSADAADYDLSLTPRKSELEIQAEIERVRLELVHKLEADKRNDGHRRNFEYIALGILGLSAAYCALIIYRHHTPDDSSRSAWTTLSSILSAAGAYVLGRNTK